ncbi:MAG: hypothetical protein HZC01_04095 [Candidatus Kerfeldbacteria bacterium]|nr:hypothetical protein [Candidatus Kerfeldbacteria bacterium]
MNMRKITRALISVSDKANLTGLVASLHSHGVEIISTGGTFKAIQQVGIPVIPVSDFTGSPEVMDGRVKTIHPKIAGGILFRREETNDWYALGQLGGKPIDLVVVNLYPFREKVAAGASHAEIVENIDIGGPSLLRAAAKNYDDVAVITEPGDYIRLMTQLDANDGQTELAFREECAGKAYTLTAAYDKEIAKYFASCQAR